MTVKYIQTERELSKYPEHVRDWLRTIAAELENGNWDVVCTRIEQRILDDQEFRQGLIDVCIEAATEVQRCMILDVASSRSTRRGCER
jgi:hypothetical protein